MHDPEVRGVALQMSVPPLHTLVPLVTQVPVPPDVQAAPPPGLPSSMLPLQLSSTPLQVSAVGEPAATLQAVLVPEHTTVPVRRQAPTPTEQLAPVARHTPEQLL